MELTRRDALAALTTLGGGTLAGCATPRGSTPGGEPPPEVDVEQVRETLVAAADVVYPDAVTGVPTFVETFLEGRFERREHAVGLDETVGALNEVAELWYGDPFPALSVADRDRCLREVGADVVSENPTGTTAERVRYYVVDELLLALYTSPTGGELVGIENPPGHPGGLESYQRGTNP